MELWTLTQELDQLLEQIGVSSGQYNLREVLEEMTEDTEVIQWAQHKIIQAVNPRKS